MKASRSITQNSSDSKYGTFLHHGTPTGGSTGVRLTSREAMSYEGLFVEAASGQVPFLA
jgi:hypothetical protein